MSPKAEIFRARAETCRRYAESADTEAVRHHWHQLTDEWNKMASEEDRRYQTRFSNKDSRTILKVTSS